MGRFRNLSIKKRITLSFLCLVVIPFILLFVIFYRTISSYAYKMSTENQTNNLYSVQEQLDDACGVYQNLSMSVYYNGYVSEEEIPEAVEKALSNLISTNSGVLSAIWEGKDSTYMEGEKFVQQQDICSRYRERVREGNGRMVWLPMETVHPYTGKAQEILTAGRVLYTADREEVGILWLYLSGNTVKNIFRRTDFLNGSRNYLMLQDGTFVWSPEDEDSKLIEETAGFYKENSSKSDHITEKVAGKKSLIVFRTSYDTKYVMISVMPQSTILQEFQGIASVFWISLCVILLFMVLIFRIVEKQIFLPVRNLTYGVDRFAGGDLEVQLNSHETGEMKKLTDHFNTMVQEVNHLMDDVKEEEHEKNEFKMQALMMQMSPHFIYNSLNTIKWIAVINKQDNIRRLIESLIQIFMNMSKRTDENNTVRDELELLQNYANIQKARFMNFDLDIQADEDTLSLRIKRFLLQPIVENAIVHGLNPSEQNGVIRIRVYKDKYLHIEISDNGVGFEVDKLNEKKGADAAHTKIGLENVQQILKLEYGEPFGMTIESEVGKGTKISYLLPAEKQEEKDK
jgi:two-component system sensor histidine kinase YesM